MFKKLLLVTISLVAVMHASAPFPEPLNTNDELGQMKALSAEKDRTIEDLTLNLADTQNKILRLEEELNAAQTNSSTIAADLQFQLGAIQGALNNTAVESLNYKDEVKTLAAEIKEAKEKLLAALPYGRDRLIDDTLSQIIQEVHEQLKGPTQTPYHLTDLK